MEFKDIPGYEGIYEINEEGKVLSKDRLVKKDSKGNFRLAKGRHISQLLPSGEHYYQVHLWRDGRGKLFRTHRLVAVTWIPNPNNLPEVNHIDGNKLNNHFSNLEWNTRLQNVRHSNKVTRNGAMICLKTIRRLYEENINSTMEEFMQILDKNCK